MKESSHTWVKVETDGHLPGADPTASRKSLDRLHSSGDGDLGQR